MFENKYINEIHATRYIVSWIKSGGDIRRQRRNGEFEQWLISLGVNEEDRRHIFELATNGKLELENSAKKFILERHSGRYEFIKK